MLEHQACGARARAANLDADILRELKETADKLCSPCKGFLAADEVRCQLRVAFQLNLT